MKSRSLNVGLAFSRSFLEARRLYVEPLRSYLRCMRTTLGRMLFITTTRMFFPPDCTQYKPKNFGSNVRGFWLRFCKRGKKLSDYKYALHTYVYQGHRKYLSLIGWQMGINYFYQNTYCIDTCTVSRAISMFACLNVTMKTNDIMLLIDESPHLQIRNHIRSY